MPFKVNSAISEQCNRILRVHVRFDIVFEVKLESAAARSALAFFVHECETDLDQLQEIYVASDQLQATVSYGTKYSQLETLTRIRKVVFFV